MSQFVLLTSQHQGGEGDQSLHESLVKSNQGFVSHLSRPVSRLAVNYTHSLMVQMSDWFYFVADPFAGSRISLSYS